MKETVRRAASDQEILTVIEHHRNKPGALLGILEEVQNLNRHKYLPEETLRFIAVNAEVPLSRIYGVATFYSFFNLTPQGDHTILVCRGTACHTRGSRILLEDISCLLGRPDFPDSGETFFTTADNRFTVRTVACFGQCALSPVIAIDGVIHSRVSAGSLKSLLDKAVKGGRRS